MGAKGEYMKGIPRFTEGTQVKTKDGRTGVVKSLASIKSGARGRPKITATVEHELGTSDYGLSDLKLA